MNEENNDIENFFSNRLNEGEIPFEEGDWNAMEDKLNEFDMLARTSGLSRWHILGLSLIGVLVFLSGWYGHQWIIDKNQTGLSTNDIALNSPENIQKDINSEKLPITDNSHLKQDVKSGEKSGNETGLSQENPQNSVSSKSQKTEMSSSWKSNSIGQVIDANGSDHSIVSDSVANKSKLNITGKQTVFRESSTNTEKYTLNLTPLSLKKPEWILRLHENVQLESLQPENEQMDIPNLKEAEKEQDLQKIRRWSVGITIAPDMNAVGSSSNYRLAWEAGLLGSYALSRKWRLSTGILYAKKAYHANGEDYNPPEGYWDYTTNGIIPDDVAARCGIIDVPLNLTFIWNPESRVHFTTTTGLSNYFILNEDYQYSFGYQYPSSGYSGWSTQENSLAFFGMLNVAVGVEWEMRNTWFVSMEPYFKVPLKEIGFGSVPLRGTGVFFSIRKQLNRK